MRAILLLLTIGLAACSGAVTVPPTAPPSVTSAQLATPTTTASATEPEPTDPPVETPSPPPGTYAARLGEAVGITCDGTDCEDVTVVKRAFASRYLDPDRSYPFDDVPSKGNVYLAVYVTYKATGSGASYNPFDWAVYVDEAAVDDSTFVEHGPKPELHSGDLPTGKTAAGWLVYEVPKTGRVTIDYQPSREAIFEVVLRTR